MNSWIAQKRATSITFDRHALERFWMQFNSDFPTEEACFNELVSRAKSLSSFACHHCGNVDLARYGYRTYRCARCHKKSWITAGTIFNRIRMARPWLAAILLLENGFCISASLFHKLAGVAYSTAFSIFKKLSTVIQRQMLDHSATLPSAKFSKLFFRRSRETPARCHPQFEEVQSESHDAPNNNSTQSDTHVSTKNLSEEDMKVYYLLGSDPLHFDTILQKAGLAIGNLSATLTILELEGLVVHLAGNRYKRQTVPSSGIDPHQPIENLLAVIAAFEAFVTCHFQGISRKYLQLYLATYWCYQDRNRWGQNSLIAACLHTPRIRNRDILDYVCPPDVSLPEFSLESKQQTPN